MPEIWETFSPYPLTKFLIKIWVYRLKGQELSKESFRVSVCQILSSPEALWMMQMHENLRQF